MTRVLVFGDSIAWGTDDLEGGGWTDRLKRWFKGTGKFKEVYNLGNGGDNSGFLLERFEAECKARIDPKYHKNCVVIIAVGTVDSQVLRENNMTLISKAAYKKNLLHLLKLAKKFSANTLFVGLLPVDEKKTDPIPWHTKYAYRNKPMREFNGIIKTVSAASRTGFIDLFDEWTRRDYHKLLADGVHPNAKGHKLIFEAVKNYLVRNKILSTS